MPLISKNNQKAKHEHAEADVILDTDRDERSNPPEIGGHTKRRTSH